MWANARIAVPAVLLFTVLTLIVTLVHIENFHLAVASLWPWALTALTGRAIGAWLFSIGIIAAHAVYEDDWRRLRPFAASYTLLAVMQLLALLRFGGEIDWSGPGGWLYVGFLLSIGVVGVAGLPWARKSTIVS